MYRERERERKRIERWMWPSPSTLRRRGPSHPLMKNEPLSVSLHVYICTYREGGHIERVLGFPIFVG